MQGILYTLVIDGFDTLQFVVRIGTAELRAHSTPRYIALRTMPIGQNSPMGMALFKVRGWRRVRQPTITASARTAGVPLARKARPRLSPDRMVLRTNPGDRVKRSAVLNHASDDGHYAVDRVVLGCLTRAIEDAQTASQA